MSLLDAAEIVGCGHGPVERMVRDGVIEQRPGLRGVPSLRRASVEAAAGVWLREKKARDEARQAAQRGLTDPPDDGQVWVGSDVAALVIGITANRVRQLAKAGRLPATMCGSKLWLRRDHVEAVAAARRFQERAESSPALALEESTANEWVPRDGRAFRLRDRQ